MPDTNIVWSDADPLWPAAGTAPTPASALGRYLAEVPDPNLDWPGPTAADTEKTVRQWLSDGVSQFFQQVLAMQPSKAALALDHAYLRQYLTATTAGSLTLTAGQTDVPLPLDCHLLLRTLLYQGAPDEVEATKVPWTWDFRVRTYPSHYGADSKRPLYAVKPSGGVRLYVAGQIAADTVYGFEYLRTPKGVYNASGTYRVDVPDTFLRGPIHYMVARWHASRDIDPSADMGEFDKSAFKAIPGATPPGASATGGA